MVTYLLFCTISKLWPNIGQILAIDMGVPHFNLGWSPANIRIRDEHGPGGPTWPVACHRPSFGGLHFWSQFWRRPTWLNRQSRVLYRQQFSKASHNFCEIHYHFSLPASRHWTTYTDQPSSIHNFEQLLLVWAIVAGLRAGPGLRWPWARPRNGLEIAGRAENFRPMHISNPDKLYLSRN